MANNPESFLPCTSCRRVVYLEGARVEFAFFFVPHTTISSCILETPSTQSFFVGRGLAERALELPDSNLHAFIHCHWATYIPVLELNHVRVLVLLTPNRLFFDGGSLEVVPPLPSRSSCTVETLPIFPCKKILRTFSLLHLALLLLL